MEKLWKFTDNNGTFVSENADSVKGLYFPLCNEAIISSITPDLHGDIKSGQDAFLTEPVSRIDIFTSRASRNFWAYINKDKIWSATGVSKDLKQIKEDKFRLEAGLLWHKVTRENRRIGLRSEILSFVPASGEPVEIMQVTITNISGRKIKFTPTAAIPLYCRGANNIRDHRHVTSLLQRITLNKYGVVVKPTLSFDEAGHKPNKNHYFVLGSRNAKAPKYIYPTQEIFCGDSGDLEAPIAVLENTPPEKKQIQGREPMGALRFKEASLPASGKVTYIILMGITQSRKEIAKIFRKFNSAKNISQSLEDTKDHWNQVADSTPVSSDDEGFNSWFRWVSIQPTLRKVYGCSFLPDFDYGKGGRGWRDLWQDCLGLILKENSGVRRMLINNFAGVRIDGSNATIIGRKPGEFIADRNDIPRVWMDHGVWPLLTLEFYIRRTKDESILFEQAPYFWDQHVWRSQKLNLNTRPSAYKGSIFEHLLIQNLTQFFNVGEHNYIRLEGADWNDGLDMAKERGESVAFSCMYAKNLELLVGFLRDSGKKSVELCQELNLLLAPVNYNSHNAKQKRLKQYFAKVEDGISGKKIKVDCAKLTAELEKKSEWLSAYIRKKEWLKEGFFNGYYDNKKRRVEGKIGGKMRMMLSSQVFAIMSGVAADGQVEGIIKSCRKYLWDKKTGGWRLNTDFGSEKLDLGRAFSFAYGNKENGAIFSHMCVMYAYALYSRGFQQEADKVMNSLYKLSTDTKNSKIYPCLPEYFDLEGRGMYSYLTGSASWYVLTYLSTCV